MTFTPLLQTNLLPDLIQVNLYPFEIVVAFSLVHNPPAFTAAVAVGVIEPAIKTASTKKER